MLKNRIHDFSRKVNISHMSVAVLAERIDAVQPTRYNVQNHNLSGVHTMQEEPLTVDEVAKQLRVSPETVRAWIRSGELDAIDVGKYLIYPSALEDFKERRRTGRKRDKQDS